MILKCSKCGGEDLEDTSVWCRSCKQWVEPDIETDIPIARTVRHTADNSYWNVISNSSGDVKRFGPYPFLQNAAEELPLDIARAEKGD